MHMHIFSGFPKHRRQQRGRVETENAGAKMWTRNREVSLNSGGLRKVHRQKTRLYNLQMPIT